MAGWILEPESSYNDKHILELRYQDQYCEGDQHWYAATVKWDGCIHVVNGCNEPFTTKANHSEADRGTDYFHICDLDEHIEMLQKLREKAIQHFKQHGQDWPR